MGLRIAVIYGSTRPQRLGIRAAKFLVRGFTERGSHVDLIEPLEHPLPLLELRYREHGEGKAPKPMETVHKILDAADAFVIVSGEYNNSIPPALANIIDHFLPEYSRKPSAVCCYSVSPFGGAHALTAVRALLAAVGAPPIGASLHVPGIADVFDDEGTPADPETMDRRFTTFAKEVEWYANALKTAREAD